MLDHRCQAERHSHAERGHNLYETPSVAVEALLRVLAGSCHDGKSTEHLRDRLGPLARQGLP
jgi:hypothetical protein